MPNPKPCLNHSSGGLRRKSDSVPSLLATMREPEFGPTRRQRRSFAANAWSPSLPPANADLVPELFVGFPVIRFTIVCADAGSGSHQLSYEGYGDRVLGDPLCKCNHRLPKTG